MRDIDKLTFMELAVRESQKEKFTCWLQEVQRKRTDLLPEHQQIQRRSHKLQSLQDKIKHYLKEACAIKEETQRIDEDVPKLRARFQALLEKSGESQRAASEVEEEIRILQAGEERRGLCPSQSNGCCWDPTMLEQFFASGEKKAASFVHYVQQEFARKYRSSGVPEQETRAEEKEAWEEDWDDERMANGWYEGAAFGSAVDPAEGSDAI